MKHGQNVCLDESRMSLKIGYVGSKTRSLGQMVEKLCVRSRGNIFSPIIMKLDQYVCLDKISYKLKIGYVRLKKWVTRSNVWKTLCTFSLIIMKLGQNVFLDEILDEF